MERKRPQLSLIELHQLRWLLGGLLALVSIWSVWYLDVSAWALLLITSGAALATLLRPTLPARWPRWVHRLAFPAVLGALIFDFYTFGEFLPALVRLAILLLLYRVSTYRKRRDDLQLILLGLFLIVTTGVLTVSVGFAFQIIVFAALALGLLLTRTLVDAAEVGTSAPEAMDRTGAPAWAYVDWRVLLRRAIAVSDWRLLGLGVFLFGALVALSAFLFLAIPRFQVDSSLFLDRLINKRSVSGFTDVLHFGEVSDIQKDDSIVLRVEVSDPAQIPSELYWRMIVMDEYRDHSFRMSAALQGSALGPEHTQASVDSLGWPTAAGTAQWTFYFEAGVSRYLPILGSFSRLYFTEPQTFRTSRELRLLMLTRDPGRMKAYRIDRMDTGSVIRSGGAGYSSHLGSKKLDQKAQEFLLELPFTEAERAQWKVVAAELSAGGKPKVQEFARRAQIWLHQRHAYSLQSQLPRGDGDPLVRWAMSNEPGHCELFAGAFTMLARAAGYPARVVGGYFGGTSNGDYLIVRNSSAHAWCEVYDGVGNWIRVDPTAPPASELGTNGRQNAPGASRVKSEEGWTAHVDRVRMLWYRRIVNFERRDQVSLAQTLKENTEMTGKEIRAFFGRLVGHARKWAVRPWDFLRIAIWTGSAGLLSIAIWFWQTQGRDRWLVWRSAHRGGVDPVRREAGRWLVRITRIRARDGLDLGEVQASLQRLRYGARETWPPPELVFRNARRVYRTAKT